MSNSTERTSISSWKTLVTHPVTVGVALWLFLPVGLVLLWLNPSLRKDRRWWAAVAVWGLYLLWGGRLPLVNSRYDKTAAIVEADQKEESGTSGSSSDKQQAAAEKAFVSLLVEADALWSTKESRFDALEKYVLLLNTYCGYGKGIANSAVGKAHQADLARVAVRAIDSLVETGNVSAAKKLIILADEQDLTLVFRNPQSDALAPKARAEKEKEDQEWKRDLERIETLQRENPLESWAEYESEGQRRSPVAPPQTATTAPSSSDSYEQNLIAFVHRYRNGMAYSEVLAILGPPSDLYTPDIRLQRPGVTFKIATWYAPNGDDFLHLGFENNALSDVRAGTNAK